MINNGKRKYEVCGRVEAIAKRGEGIKIGGRWYNMSKYAATADVEQVESVMRGCTVRMTVDDARWYYALSIVDPSETETQTETETETKPETAEAPARYPSQMLEQDQYLRLRSAEIAAQVVAQLHLPKHPDGLLTPADVACAAVLDMAARIAEWIETGSKRDIAYHDVWAPLNGSRV